MFIWKKKQHLMSIFLHVLAWTVYFIINYFFVKNYRVEFNLGFHVKSWAIQLVLFYINYFVLLPFLFFRKKSLWYVAFSLLFLTGAYFVKSIVDDNHFMKHMPKMVKTIEQQPSRSISENGELRPKSNKRYRIKPPPFKLEGPKHSPGSFRGKLRFFPIPSLLMIYMASLLARFIQKWRNDEKKRSEEEKEKISNELTFLKQQINPHFLFNSLNSIYSLSMSKSEQTTDAILKLSSILRYVLYEGQKQTVSLENELDSLHDYIELQKLRLSHKVKLHVEFIGEFSNFRIEPLLLLPIVENAFKHGVDNVNESTIDIKVAINDKGIEMWVVNKKMQSQKQKFEGEGGIGIENIKRRLELIYPDRYIFKITDHEESFSVYLNLRLI